MVDADRLLRDLFEFFVCDHRFKARVRLTVERTTIEFSGDWIMQLPDNCQVHASITYVDAKGNPAVVDGVPVWSTDRTDLLNVVVAEDGMSADIAAVGPLGTAQVVVDADADLGAGTKSIKTIGSIEVIGGEAVSGVINFGEPVPAP